MKPMIRTVRREILANRASNSRYSTGFMARTLSEFHDPVNAGFALIASFPFSIRNRALTVVAHMIEPEPLEFLDGNYVRFRGRKLLYFSGCDYFRLSRNRTLLAEAKATLSKYGLNVAASRITTGNHPLYSKLENQLRSFFQSSDALLVGSGYMTNLIVAQ